MQTIETTNGVNVEQLVETIEAIREQPEIADFRFRVTNRWVDGGQNETTISGYFGACQEVERERSFELAADEPPVLLGNDSGPNPVEYALTALASCMTTTMVYHAAARGIRVESVESRLEGDLDLHGFLGLKDDVRKGYKDVRVSFKVKADATPEQLAELTKYSPVFDIFSNPVPVSVDVEME
jgi:uncharacterized OsmC-like protein